MPPRTVPPRPPGYAASAIVPTASIVLASRAQVVTRLAQEAYPLTRETRVTFAGTGYQDGYREGGKADIGSATLARHSLGGLSRLPSHPVSASSSSATSCRPWQAARRKPG